MQVISGRNVNQLWARAVPLLMRVGRGETNERTQKSVIVAPFPVMSATTSPRERVLFDPARDANPFFHFFESLWMLAGRNDAQFLDTFVGNFGSKFAETDGFIHGAYGKRWYDWFCLDGMYPVDQIEAVISVLTEDPTSRQAVIAMWDPAADLQCVEDGEDRNVGLKDRPCNTHIYLRVRNEIHQPPLGHVGVYAHAPDSYLDMTVCCRSNDIVWGAYGANIVHFSFLLEYLAGRLGVRVGTLYQFSNNWHAYVDVLEAYHDRVDGGPTVRGQSSDWYNSGSVQPTPIGEDWGSWRKDLFCFLEDPMDPVTLYKNSWFYSVARPMFETHSLWKRGEKKVALGHADNIAASDWRRAAREWMQRRMT